MSQGFRVLQDTPDYIIVDKKPGLSFHQEAKQPGLVQLLKRSYASNLELYPVHRLDKLSSGLLLFAKGRRNANMLSNIFRHHRIKKIYLALGDRHPRRHCGTVIGAMKKSRGGSWELRQGISKQMTPPSLYKAGRSVASSLAKTCFFSAQLRGRRSGLRLYVLYPVTGKTHQLRVAMKSIGVPIMGDLRYSPFSLARMEDRCYLHAYSLSFKFKEKDVYVSSKPQDGIEFQTPEFLQCLEKLESKAPLADLVHAYK